MDRVLGCIGLMIALIVALCGVAIITIAPWYGLTEFAPTWVLVVVCFGGSFTIARNAVRKFRR